MLCAIVLGSAVHLIGMAATSEVLTGVHAVEIVAIRDDREPIWRKTLRVIRWGVDQVLS